MLLRVKLTRPENVSYFGCLSGDIVPIDIEEYVAGVVASEIGNAPIEACKAQAIAARTFAMNHVGDDNYITDKSSVHQAFRTSRWNADQYPNANAAAMETAGMVLMYDGEILKTCSYSSSNGGHTVSSQERWGGIRPYLIAQDDPWDAAACAEREAKGYAITKGHGVGMSQYGAAWAANHGVGYRKILGFYYVGADIVGNYGKEDTGMTDDVNSAGNTTSGIAKDMLEDSRLQAESVLYPRAPFTASELIALFRQALDEHWGYIWGEAGGVWTQAEQDAATREKTVLYGQRWVGRKVADCSGLLAWAVRTLGAIIYHGSNTIWNSYTDPDHRGAIAGTITIPPGAAVFQVNNGRRTHIGLYIGGGKCIEAQGTQTGVVESDISAWDEWAELLVKYGGELLKVDYDLSYETLEIMPQTLRKGDSGSLVQTLQNGLIEAGYDVGTKGADGHFGTATQSAVRKFQTEHNLNPDGIVGPLTWAALKAVTEDDEPDAVAGDSSATGGTDAAVCPWDGMTTAERTDWLLEAVRLLADGLIERGCTLILQDGHLVDKLLTITGAAKGGDPDAAVR